MECTPHNFSSFFYNFLLFVWDKNARKNFAGRNNYVEILAGKNYMHGMLIFVTYTWYFKISHNIMLIEIQCGILLFIWKRIFTVTHDCIIMLSVFMSLLDFPAQIIHIRSKICAKMMTWEDCLITSWWRNGNEMSKGWFIMCISRWEICPVQRLIP